jgi:hypothetical protein
VAAGHGIRFQQGHVLLLYAASDPNTYEIMWVVSSPVADTLTVKRPQGGTTALARIAGDIIKIIGIAMPELTNYPLGPVTRGDLFYNYPQRFMTKVQVDIARENTPDYENKGSWIALDAAQRTADLKLDLERALIYGRRQLGSPDTSPKQPYMMSGAIHFAELGGNLTDLNQALLTIEDLGDMGSRIYDIVGTKGGKDLAMSNNTRRIFDRLLNNNRIATMSETRANLTWSTVTLSDGTSTCTRAWTGKRSPVDRRRRTAHTLSATSSASSPCRWKRRRPAVSSLTSTRTCPRIRPSARSLDDCSRPRGGREETQGLRLFQHPLPSPVDCNCGGGGWGEDPHRSLHRVYGDEDVDPGRRGGPGHARLQQAVHLRGTGRVHHARP